MRRKIPKEGDRRVVKRFLWFPRTIAGEMRWLERATWAQIMKADPSGTVLYWEDMGWGEK